MALIIFATFFYWTFNNGVYKVQVILKTSTTRTPLIPSTQEAKICWLSPKCFYGYNIYFLLLFRLFVLCLRRETLSLSRLLRRVSTFEYSWCSFVHMTLCYVCSRVCVCLSRAKHVTNSMCLIINSVLVNFASSMVTYCNAPYMILSVKSSKNFNIHQQIPHEKVGKDLRENISGETEYKR